MREIHGYFTEANLQKRHAYCLKFKNQKVCQAGWGEIALALAGGAPGGEIRA
jgi:hypothetical protein